MIDIVWNVADDPQDYEAAMRRALSAALESEGRRGDVCVEVVSGERIRELNRVFREVDAVTDVLTFPAWEGDAVVSPPDGYLGDIAVCFERAARQAGEYGHSLLRELSFLSVHGALHLCGYDHMTPSDEAVMIEKQNDILRSIKVDR